MDRDTAVASIKVGLGFKTTLDANIVTALVEAQNDLEAAEYLPTFLKTAAFTDLSTAADTETVAFPTGFLREIDEEPLIYYDSTADDNPYIELTKDDTGFLRQKYASISFSTTATRVPKAYSIDTAIHIFPLVDGVYTLKWRYYKADTSLAASNIENSWLKYAHQLMIGTAGLKIAQGLRDKDAINYFSGQIALGTKRMMASQIAVDQAARSLAMGGED